MKKIVIPMLILACLACEVADAQVRVRVRPGVGYPRYRKVTKRTVVKNSHGKIQTNGTVIGRLWFSKP